MGIEKDNGVFVRELTVRYRKKRVPKKARHLIGRQLSSQLAAGNLFRYLQDETVEKFFVLHLNTQNIIDSFQLCVIGTLDGASVCPRDVFQGALLGNAARIICVHNHPSGNPSPSEEDKSLTRELKSVGEIIGIKLLDHLIIGREKFYSLHSDMILSY